jgi:hypothetical protein
MRCRHPITDLAAHGGRRSEWAMMTPTGLSRRSAYRQAIKATDARYGLPHRPFCHVRLEGHLLFSLQGFGHTPTKHAGADVYSAFESTAQRISTSRPSQPQRPPGSMQRVVLLGTMHLLNLSPRKPQRSPEGHSASLVQAKDGCEGLSSDAAVAWVLAALPVSGRALPHATRHRVRAIIDSLNNTNAPTSNSDLNVIDVQAYPVQVDEAPCKNSQWNPWIWAADREGPLSEREFDTSNAGSWPASALFSGFAEVQEPSYRHISTIFPMPPLCANS